MDTKDWIDLIVALLAGMATAIPLVVKLVQYVKKAVKEKNWARLLELVMKQMEIAEQTLTTGAEKKAYVMAAVSGLAGTVDYEVDLDELNALIDRLCDMSKIVNAPEGEA